MAFSVSGTRRRSALLLLLLALALLFAAVAAKHEGEDARGVEDESSETWTSWAKEKISGGLGLKHQPDEEELSQKAGQTVKSAREKTQDAASSN